MKKTLLIVALLGLLLSACAAAWPYKHYTVDITALPEPEKAFLRDVKPTGDLNMTVCLPNAQSKAPCVVLTQDTYFQLKAAYEKLQIQLIACQQQRK